VKHEEPGGARMRGSGGSVQRTVIGAPQCRHRNGCGEGLLARASVEVLDKRVGRVKIAEAPGS